jgi:pre-mRNA-processing factor 19
MSTIVCAISGNAAEHPVFSPKTGYVYEKGLITKQIYSSGRCPVSKEELTKDDLVDVQCNKTVRPRPATATSIPGMLTLLQSEWDAIMSEQYELKSQLDTSRKQLSHALYQHDAACRVIARLIRERDAARAQVAGLQDQLLNSTPMAGGGGSRSGQDVETGLTPDILKSMEEIAATLSKTRKQKNFPDLTPVADVKAFTCVGSHPIHQSTAPGILCLDVHRTDGARIATGGVDGQVILFDADKEKNGAEASWAFQEGDHRAPSPLKGRCCLRIAGCECQGLDMHRLRLECALQVQPHYAAALCGGHRSQPPPFR